MKILLVNPHSSNWTKGAADNSSVAVRSAPVGLLSISAFLKRSGHDVKIIDLSSLTAELSKKRFIGQLHSFRPDIAGFTAVTSNFLNAIQLAETVKNISPDTVTVFGGVHVSALRGAILEKFDSIDMIVAGEGEEAMAEIASGAPCSSIKGLIYREGDAIRDNGARGLLCDLDSLPFPDYHALEGFPSDYEGALFNYPKGPVATVISSRGCPYSCSYCDRSVFGSSFRHNSPGYLHEQMQFLKSEFGIRHVFFYDDLFTFNRGRIEEFCRLLREKPLGMTFNCAVRVGHIDDDLLKTLKASGCWMVSLGVESGSPEILARHKSNVNFDEMKDTVTRIRRAGLRAKGLFMMGLPGETEQTFRMTADFINALELDDMNLTKFTPFPGSPLYKTIHDEGAFDEKWELMNCMNFVFVPRGIPSKERMDELYREFIRDFYTGKNWISKFPGLMFKSPESVKRIIRHLPRFLKIRKEFAS